MTPADAATLSIVVPTFNERDRLQELVETTFAVWREHSIAGELVIVDDNSPDGTGALADQLAARFRLRVIHRAGKLGLGTAVIAGFNAASSDIVGVMDADLSHPPQLLAPMLALMRSAEADAVVASRYIDGGGTTNWGLGRLVMSRVACVLARPLTPVRDATSGFFLIRRSLAQSVTISAGGFKIALELLVRGRARVIVEVPYVFGGRTAGESKMNVREAAGYIRQLGQLLRFRLFDAKGTAVPRYHQVAAADLLHPAFSVQKDSTDSKRQD
jgi:dolichol-phosphate mannosyltransferase